jgi:hypothetical protein
VTSPQCPTCNRGDGVRFNSGHDRDGFLLQQVTCPVCGTYVYRVDAVGFNDSASQRLRPYIAAYVRQAMEAGAERVALDRDWPARVAPYAETTVSRKLDRLLKWLASNSEHPGAFVGVAADRCLWPLFDAKTGNELQFLIGTLIAQGLLEGSNGKYKVTADGWTRLSTVPFGGVPGTCFVAMWFDSSLDPAYDVGIEPAVEGDCGFRVIQLARVQHNDNINDKIIADIRAAQFIVADFTGHRGGVYFEAGYALGLGRPVIWTCRKDHFSETHFDTRPYNYVVWETPEELRSKLASRIRATIPNARPAYVG